MLEKYNLQGNHHLDLMFRTRKRWVPAYFREIFFADMFTSQRSESANSVLKLWTDSHTSIYKFVLQFTKMVEGIVAKEDEEDFRSSIEQPQLWSFYPIEVETRRVYTRKIYSIFKNLLRQSTKYNIQEVENDELYDVKRIHDPATSNWKLCAYQVRVNKANNMVSCNCKGFEFEDLLCSHSIAVMQNCGIHLDHQYVLARWTKEANQGLKKNQIDMRSIEAIRSDTDRYEYLRMKAMKIVDDFWRPLELYTIASTKLETWYNELDEIAKGMRSDISTEHVEATTVKHLVESGESCEEINYRDPSQSQCKRRRKPERHKHPIEKKMRTCSNCHLKTGHNAQTCPKLKTG